MTLRRISILAVLFLLVGPARAGDDLDYATLRGRMVDVVQIQTRTTEQLTGVSEIDPKVLEVMRAVPRHLFVPPPIRPYAYNNHPLPLGYEQNIASPFLVALMTHLAAPKAGDVVFETGTGAGYHAAVLARLAAAVYSVDVIEEMVSQASATLAELQFDNARARVGDGYYGWKDRAPFDVIIVKEAVDHVPVPLLNQLKPGGRMVIPLTAGGGEQFLTLVEKLPEGVLRRTRVLPVRFSPLQGGERT